jgi:Protein of unknown function (DUF1194)
MSRKTNRAGLLVGEVPAICRNLLAASVLVLASFDHAYGDAKSVDTALVFAIDASASIDEERFSLQLQSIASVFHDSEVQGSVVAGPDGSVLVTLVQWSSHAFVSIPWTRIATAAQADAFAKKIRGTQRIRDYVNFTCVSVALRAIQKDVLPAQPAPARRTIIDISGNGIDNCSLPTSSEAVRDELVAAGATINALPILEGSESLMLETWYRDHVIGGLGAFMLPAQDFADMDRAMRRKFLLEISLSYR